MHGQQNIKVCCVWFHFFQVCCIALSLFFCLCSIVVIRTTKKDAAKNKINLVLLLPGTAAI